MENYAQDQEELRLYLLGLLPQERRPMLEERLLTDAAFYEGLSITEDELIDEYLAGELTADERGGFEAHFMNAPERQQQARFAGALRAYIDDNVSVSGEELAEPSSARGRETVPVVLHQGFLSRLRRLNPLFALSVAAALLLLCGVSWLALRSSRPRAQPQVLTVLLTPGGVTRAGGDVQKVTTPPGTDEVRLQLRIVGDESQNYRASLLDAEGTTVFNAASLKPETAAGGEPVVVILVPAQDVPPGDYQIRLDRADADGEFESADTYRFTVLAR